MIKEVSLPGWRCTMDLSSLSGRTSLWRCCRCFPPPLPRRGRGKKMRAKKNSACGLKKCNSSMWGRSGPTLALLSAQFWITIDYERRTLLWEDHYFRSGMWDFNVQWIAPRLPWLSANLVYFLPWVRAFAGTQPSACIPGPSLQSQLFRRCYLYNSGSIQCQHDLNARVFCEVVMLFWLFWELHSDR